MEAVWRIEVEDFPAFIVVDDKGNDFFADAAGPLLRIGRAGDTSRSRPWNHSDSRAGRRSGPAGV